MYCVFIFFDIIFLAEFHQQYFNLILTFGFGIGSEVGFLPAEDEHGNPV
jgi:hypothetical protein